MIFDLPAIAHSLSTTIIVGNLITSPYIDQAPVHFGFSKTTMENSQLSISKVIQGMALEDMISRPQQIPPSLLTMSIAERWTTSFSTVLAMGPSGFSGMMVMTSY